MKKTIALVSLLVCLTLVLSSCGGSGLSGTYTGTGSITEMKFSGSNKITFKSSGNLGLSMSGTYSIADGKITINYSYSLLGQSQDDEENWTFEQKDNSTIVVDGQELKKS